jgi:hypothetical protein
MMMSATHVKVLKYLVEKKMRARWDNIVADCAIGDTQPWMIEVAMVELMREGYISEERDDYDERVMFFQMADRIMQGLNSEYFLLATGALDAVKDRWSYEKDIPLYETLMVLISTGMVTAKDEKRLHVRRW